MKRNGGGGTDPEFLTMALDGDEWSASRPGPLTPPLGGGRVGPVASLDAVVE
jgi:hypothetical protein